MMRGVNMNKTISLLLASVLVFTAVAIGYSAGAVTGHDAVCSQCRNTGDMDQNGTVDIDDAIHLLFHANFPENYALPGCEYQEPYSPPTNSGSIRHPLDGKKFIFIGNSYTYYGKCVINTSSQSQSERSNDKGYFYQIAKENGADIEVTNWTFGNHCLEDTFGGSCAANRGCDGKDHTKDLTDRYFDYVMFQESSLRIDGFLESVESIMTLFRAENPNVKFFCLVPLRLYEWQNSSTECRNVLKNLKTVEEMGATIVDWGKIVYDIYNNNTEVPGSDLTYNRNSFVISQSASDGHHQNMLVGYITALMTWSAVTGDTAVGQEYRFTGDPTVNSAFDFEKFRDSYYTYGNVTTNFDTALKSKTEVTGFQKLIDKYLAEKGYRNYK